MATIETVKKQDGSVVYPQTVYSAVCDSDGTTLAQDMSSVIHSQSVQSVEELPELLRDVKINGTSVVEDGVANIPIASPTDAGVIKISTGWGVSISGGSLMTNPAGTVNIDNRDYVYKTIGTGNLDYAVKAAMCDGKGATWIDSEKKAARARLGVDFEYITTVEISNEISVIEVDLESDYREIAMMVIVKPAETTSNNGTLFILPRDSSSVATINAEVYVANGIGGTAECVSFMLIHRFDKFTRAMSARNASGTYHFVQQNKSENLIHKIRLSGNNVRYFGVGSSIILYGKK